LPQSSSWSSFSSSPTSLLGGTECDPAWGLANSKIEEPLQNVLAGQEIFIEILSALAKHDPLNGERKSRRPAKSVLGKMKASGNH
jgi:hypothetical protein